MVHIPRHRRRGGTPRSGSRPPYDDDYDPHYNHRNSANSRSQFILLFLGMCIGYLVLPVLLVQNKQIGLEEVVQRLEEKQRASQTYASGKDFQGTQVSSPFNMMQNHRDGAASMLRTHGREHNGQAAWDHSGDSRRRTVGPELKVAENRDGASSSLLDAKDEASSDEPKTVKSKEDREDELRLRDEVESIEAISKNQKQSNEHESGDANSGSESQPIAVPDHSRDNLSQILTAEKQTQEDEEHDLSEAQKRFVETQKLIASQSIPTSTNPHVMKTPNLPDAKRKKILVTGGAGFVGSHLVDKLMMEGHEVVVLDNFFTGQRKNVEHWMHHPRFSLVVHDVTEPIMLEVDEIYHLACPASPPHYQYNPVKTIKTSTMGTINMLGLAKRVKAKILLTSTSEIYGDPKVHPQPESYWGNVNTIGPRSCYDEGKRVAETMMYSYKNQNNVDVRVARIFNTFGPRMHPNDGRVVSNFIIQSLQDKPMTIYGDGSQTRSFQYVSDLVDGLHALMNGQYDLPVNLGNPDEYTVKHFAEYIKEITGSKSEISFLNATQDDPTQRKPDISTAKRELNWEPKVTVKEGLHKTIAYFSRVLDESGEIIPTGQDASRPKPKIVEMEV
ncbi:hypothetical protein ACHAW6_012059 [Cyclotella cf. meneghiniana]